jgi:DNA-binding transcriptional LysR family regulator
MRAQMRPSVDLNNVAVFVEVVERGSFTAAAASLGLPKSSVSRSVARLENELGVTLLRRTTRKIALTDAGREWFERARRALSELEDAGAVASRDERDPHGIVRLTAPPDAARALVDALARFAERYPRVHVELIVTSRRLDLIEERIDLALRGGQLSDSSLIARKLFESALGLYAAPSYLERRGRPKSLADLAQHDVVLFRGVRGRSTLVLEGPRGRTKVDVTGPISADDFTTVVDALLAGMGIGLAPEVWIQEPVLAGRLERVLPKWSVRGGAIHLLHAGTRLPERVRLLRDFLVQELTSLAGSGGR